MNDVDPRDARVGERRRARLGREVFERDARRLARKGHPLPPGDAPPVRARIGRSPERCQGRRRVELGASGIEVTRKRRAGAHHGHAGDGSDPCADP